MDLIEELDAVQKPKNRRGTCSFCEWLEAQSPDDQGKWDRVCLPKSGYSADSLRTVVKKHGADVGTSVIKAHRAQGHRA